MNRCLTYPGLSLALILAACQPSEPASIDTPSSVGEFSFTAGEQLAMACSGCHSDLPGSAIPSLKNLSENDLVEKLTTYSTDTDGSTVMHRLARGYTESEIISVSAWLAGHRDD